MRTTKVYLTTVCMYVPVVAVFLCTCLCTSTFVGIVCLVCLLVMYSYYVDGVLVCFLVVY